MPDDIEPQPPPPGVVQHYRRPKATEHQRLVAAGRRATDHDRFARPKTLQAEGGSHVTIVRETGLNWRTVAKWTHLEALPERRKMAPKATTPEHFRSHLARRWGEGYTMDGNRWWKSKRLITPEV